MDGLRWQGTFIFCQNITRTPLISSLCFQNLTAANFENPLVILIVSMVIGALAGYLSGQLAKVMTRKV